MAEDFSFKASIDVGVNNSQKAVGDINAIVKQLELLNKTAAKSLDELTSLNEKGLGRTSKAAKETEDATKKLNQAQQDQTKNLPRLRYALYDVSSTMAGLSAATLGGVAAALTFSASFEKAFTAVERTTMASGDALDLLRNQLIKLASEVPIAFQDLSQIAALGSQLGIASNDLIGFTKTVSEFAATTNVSVDEAGKSFGRLGELLDVTPDKYRNLASAVSLVGVSSAATETEILRTATGLAGVAKTAGLSTEFIIGLAGSLASLGIPAEQSRGALTRIFQEINRAAAQGGPTLDAFAQVLGKTTAETKQLAQSDLEGFFQQLIIGLSGLDAGQLTSTLDAINLADIRVTNTLSRLSKNQAFTNDLINQASAEYKTGAYLGFAYGKTVDDLASKFQILQNSLSILGANIGDAIAPVAKDVLNVIIDLVNGLSAFVKTPIGQTLVTINAAFTILLGTMAALVGSLALAGASIAATRTALAELGVSAGIASAAVGTLSTIVKGFGWAGLALAVFDIVSGFIGMGQAAQDTSSAFTNMIGDTTGLAEAVAADTQAYADAVAAGNQTVADSYVNLGTAAAETNPELQAYQDNLRNTAGVLGVELPSAFDTVNGAISSNTAYLGENTIAWVKGALLANQAFQDLMATVIFTGGAIVKSAATGKYYSQMQNESFSYLLNQTKLNYDTLIKITSAQGYEAGKQYFIQMVNAATALTPAARQALIARVSDVVRPIAGLGSTILQLGNTMSTTTPPLQSFNNGIKDLGKNSQDTAKKVRTLVDYANDLGGVLSRAFDIRWQSMLDADKTADSWASLSDRIQSAKDKILGLTATRGKLEYFLSIAVKAGDQVRIAELQSELAKTSQDLADATDEASASLSADTVIGRKNRRELLNIIQSNEDYIKSLAAEGASKAKLRAETARLRQEFVAQATALGFSATEVNNMAKSFDDMTTIINKVPRKITVDANTDPALQALAEFKAQADAATVDRTANINTKVNPDLNAAKILDIQSQYLSKKALYNQQLLAKNYAGAIKTADAMAVLSAQLKALGGWYGGEFYTGGYTGRGGKYQPAGIVHKGEYVIPKEHVNQSTGLPYADALGRAMPASAPATSGYAGGGLVGAGSMMVSLSPDDRALLRAVGGSGDIVVAVDSREIARANAKGAKLVTAEGGYLV